MVQKNTSGYDQILQRFRGNIGKTFQNVARSVGTLTRPLTLVDSDPQHTWNKEYNATGQLRGEYYISWLSKYVQIEDTLVLDLGCGFGFHSLAAQSIGGIPILVDLQPSRVRTLPQTMYAILADATRLPLRSGLIDVVFSYDMYEHIEEQEALVAEKFRVARPGGLVSWVTGNKFFPLDRHTGLLFIDLLPKRVATAWVRKMGVKRQYNIYEPSFFSLARQLRRFSTSFMIDPVAVVEMFQMVYSHIFSKMRKRFRMVSLLIKLGIFWLVTPKFFVVSRLAICPGEPPLHSKDVHQLIPDQEGEEVLQDMQTPQEYLPSQVYE